MIIAYMKNKKRNIIVISVVLSLALWLSLHGPMPAAAAPAEVAGSTVNVRTGAGTNHSLVGQLPQGSIVEVLDQNNGWSQIQSATLSGWIRSDLLKAIPPNYVEVTKAAVNLRSQPNTTSEIVGSVKAGDKIQLVERLPDWYKVRTLAGQEVYIAAGLVKEIYYQVSPGTPVIESPASAVTTPTTPTPPVTASPPSSGPQVFLEGEYLQFTDVAPMIKNGRTLVPLRAIFEALDAQVSWEEATREVTSTRGSTVVKLKIAATEAQVNGQPVTLDVPAQIINDRTVVPIRFIGEAFGGKVGWDPDTQRIDISMPLPEVTPSNPPSTAIPPVTPLPDTYVPSLPQHVQVAGVTVDLLEAPFEGARVVGQVNRGEIMTVRAQQNGWYQVNRGGADVWLSGELVVAWEADEPRPDDEIASGSSYQAPNLSGDVIHAGFKEDKHGIGLILSSGRKLDFTVDKTPGRIEYNFKNVNFLNPPTLSQSLGEGGSVQVVGTNIGADARVIIDLPSELKYEEKINNGGKEQIVFIPNRIIGISREVYADRGDKIIITTLRPIEYSYEEENRRVIVKLKDVVLGSARADYDYVGKVLDHMKITSKVEADGSNSLFLTVDTKRDCKFNFVKADNVLHIVATVKTQEDYMSSNLIILDAGHGGADSGAQRNGIQEKNIVLPITLSAGAILESKGFQVAYTRTGDNTVGLEERSKIANERNGAIFVSIHANANTKIEPNGTETYFYAPLDRPELLQQRMEREKLATLLQREVVGRIHRTDRGVKEANFSVLRNTRMPSALLEAAFLSNAEERSLLIQDSFQRQIAEGVAAAIEQYMRTR